MPSSPGAATKFSEDRFGGPTRLAENPLGGTIGATPTQVLANNPDRVAWFIWNRAPAPMGLGFSQAVDLVNFAQVDANGGMVSMVIQDDGEAVTYPVYLIAAAAAQIAYIVEVERV